MIVTFSNITASNLKRAAMLAMRCDPDAVLFGQHVKDRVSNEITSLIETGHQSAAGQTMMDILHQYRKEALNETNKRLSPAQRDWIRKRNVCGETLPRGIKAQKAKQIVYAIQLSQPEQKQVHAALNPSITNLT